MIGMSTKTGRTLRDRQHLAQSIADIVTTPLGSRIMRRESVSYTHLTLPTKRIV